MNLIIAAVLIAVALNLPARRARMPPTQERHATGSNGSNHQSGKTHPKGDVQNKTKPHVQDKLAGRLGTQLRTRLGAQISGRLCRQQAHTAVEGIQIAFDLQMLAACLQAGLSPAVAVATVGRSSAEPAWKLVSTLINMGVPDQRAWEPLLQNPHCREVVALARASGRTGAGLEQGCRRIATELLQQQQHAATAKAQKSGVLIAMPLTMCFLPAFFLLGLLPVVLDLGMELFGGLDLSPTSSTASVAPGVHPD